MTDTDLLNMVEVDATFGKLLHLLTKITQGRLADMATQGHYLCICYIPNHLECIGNAK